MTEKTSSGNKIIDELLGGGLNKHELNMVYGEAATGKTTLCLMFAIEMASKGKKTIFLDSENGFSIERLNQLKGIDISKIIENIFVIKLKDFEDQKEKIEKLKDIVKKGNFEGVVLDTIGYHYRNALKSAPYRVNKEADNQFRVLKDLAMNGVCILITNQVYANFKEKNDVEMVGGKMFRNWSNVLVKIKKENENERCALLLKPIKKENKKLKGEYIVPSIKFKIKERGFIPL